MNSHLAKVCLLIAALLLPTGVTCAFAGEPAKPDAGKDAPKWVALWHDAYKGTELESDPVDRMYLTGVAADRVTGDTYLHVYEYGILKSTDAGKTFARVDGGKVGGAGAACCAWGGIQVSPNGKKVAAFTILGEIPGARPNPAFGGSGYSLDGGATWQSFLHARWPEPGAPGPDLVSRGWPAGFAFARDWEMGAVDWDTLSVLASCHDPDGLLLLSADAGKTWAKVDRKKGVVAAVGIVGPQTLLVGTGTNIERSADGGKTWSQVADFNAAGAAQKFNDKLWWLSPAKKGVIVSGDGGQTWSLRGEPVPSSNVIAGPIFGKNEDHIIVTTKESVLESTDGCKTWKPVIAIPDGYGAFGTAAAYDVVHDIFYVTGMRKPVLKYQRSGTPEPEAPSGKCQPPEDPNAPVSQFIESIPLPGMFTPYSLAWNGDYLYVSSTFGQCYFKRDPQTEKLTYVEGIFNGRNKRGKLIAGGYTLRFAGGRMYKVGDDGKGIGWCDIDAKTGKPVEKGWVDCPPAWQMIVAPDQKSLYLKTCGVDEGKVLWYRLDADGKPVKAGEVTGKGVGANQFNKGLPELLQMSPDGKFLYAVSSQDYAIACIERKATGEIAIKSTTDLDTVVKRPAGYDRYRWVSVAPSPDGKWLYASVFSGRPSINFYAIFQRDPKNGALSLKETITGDKDPLANLRGWAMTFLPNGSGGYLGCCTGPLLTFKYDSKTGHLTDLGMVKGTRDHGIEHFVWDADRRFLYAGSYDSGLFQSYGFGIYVLKSGN